jgi:hypothetical protein
VIEAWARNERSIPPHAPGMRIGLFGGTFDPPHQAHLGAALLALKRLQLDRVWWLVTPGNPLKDTRGLAPLSERIKAARALTKHHPRIDVSGLEAIINTRYTYDTIRFLITRCPGVRFVWIMGADNLAQLPSLAEVARDREHGPYRGGGPAWAEPLRRRGTCGPGARPLPHSGISCDGPARAQAAGMVVPARAEVAVVVHGIAGAAKEKQQER